jgi:hypothetical protein
MTPVELLQRYIDAHPHDPDVIAFRQALAELRRNPPPAQPR